MLMPKAPGVYTREIDNGVRAITGGATAVALFIGPTRAGVDLRPQRIASFADFERLYGGLSQTSNLSYSALHYFANGGGEAYVVRVPADGAVAAESGFKAAGSGDRVVTLTALSSGEAGDQLLVEFDSFGLDGDPLADRKDFNIRITDRLSGRTERFGAVTTSPVSARNAAEVLNDPDTGSRLVELTLDKPDARAPRATGTIVTLADPAGNTFAKPVRLGLQVDIRGADGKVGETVKLDEVLVFEAGDEVPSRLEVAQATASAINSAIRADAAALAAMEGLEIEAELVGDGDYARFRVSAPGPEPLAKRVHDATVRIVAPKPAPAGGEKGWLAHFSTDVQANPSRYQLGAPYDASEVEGAPVAGDDGKASGQPKTADFKKAVMDLQGRDPFFTILCLPDLVRPSAADPLQPFHGAYLDVYGEAARLCEKTNAFLIVDPPPGAASVGAALAWKTKQVSFRSSHAGAWFPNIRVDDPLQPGSIRSHPPSGAIAGVMARTDGEVGVWQAPAGTDAFIAGVYGPSLKVSEDDHAQLNPVGVNCIRQFPIYGAVSFGSRTLEGADVLASNWKYVPVRRTSSYILRTLKESLRWAVHKPNGEELWSQLRISVTGFMHDLFRQGAFKGVSAREAYFVLCDATTTTPDDQERGIVNIQIGFAPLRPAEFVIVNLRQIVQPAA